MDQSSESGSEKAIALIQATVANCEKMQLKFAEGTPQHTLLRNRIKALRIARALLMEDGSASAYSDAELSDAIRPIASIISKCQSGKQKHASGSATYARLQRTIDAMETALKAIYSVNDSYSHARK